METTQAKSTLPSKLLWSLVAIVGAISFGILAVSRGEHVNAVWLVLAAVCVYSIAYRFYSLFIANKVFELNPRRLTPAHRLNDGLDYVPTNKYVLFGHHFAAIAGAGPLVGPILAAQMGYLPGTIWLLVGVVIAGAVQDFLVLFITIACGAISGFHALVSSGTTPKLVDNEVNIRMIGYGGMLMESGVGIMAMI